MSLSIAELNVHYLNPREMVSFFALSFVCMFVSVLILIRMAKSDAARGGRIPGRRASEKAEWLTQAFYEMMFSDTCILGFIGTYVIIDWFVTKPAIRSFWDSYSDFILLGLIILSCVLNTFLDHVFVNLKRISHEEKASIRLIGMLYMGIIFLYIKFVYADNNYDKIMVYYLSLMVGRFVYFDASFRDFRKSVKDAARNFPIMLMALADTAVMAAYGFSEGYLLKKNGVVVSLLVAHIYMIVCIFIIHHTHMVRHLTGHQRGKNRESRESQRAENYDLYDDDYGDYGGEDDDDYGTEQDRFEE